jgi:hypothetical protein
MALKKRCKICKWGFIVAGTNSCIGCKDHSEFVLADDIPFDEAVENLDWIDDKIPSDRK